MCVIPRACSCERSVSDRYSLALSVRRNLGYFPWTVWIFSMWSIVIRVIVAVERFGIQCIVMCRVLVSVNVMKYLFPCRDGVGRGPHISDEMC